MASGLDEAVQKIYGLDPAIQNRPTLLPYSKEKGWVAPQIIYDLARASLVPGYAARGNEVPPEEVMGLGAALVGAGPVSRAGRAGIAALRPKSPAERAPEGFDVLRGGARLRNYENFKGNYDRPHAVDNGLGIYATRNTPTAKYYAEKSKGKVNKLRVGAPRNTLLNRDVPLSEQPSSIVDSLKKAGLYEGNEGLTGAEFYEKLVKQNATPVVDLLQRGSNVPSMQKANELLQRIGVRGMSYTANHTGKDVAEHYVVFSGKDIIPYRAGGSVENTTYVYGKLV